PKAKEGELSRLRASLVRGETLATLSKEFKIGDDLRLAVGELKSGGCLRGYNFAHGYAGPIGPLFFQIESWFGRRPTSATVSGRFETTSLISVSKDAKTQLQEWLQAKKLSLPRYPIIKIEGEAHAQTFHIECRIPDLSFVTEGVGSGRRRAEQQAAKNMLLLL